MRVEEALAIRLLDLPRDVPVVTIGQGLRTGLDEGVVVDAAETLYPSDRYGFSYDIEVR